MKNMQNKRQQLNQYLNELGKQIQDNEAKKKREQLENQMPTNTTLLMQEKRCKNYNCKVCHHNYPLKMLNKIRRE